MQIRYPGSARYGGVGGTPGRVTLYCDVSIDQGFCPSLWAGLTMVIG